MRPLAPMDKHMLQSDLSFDEPQARVTEAGLQAARLAEEVRLAGERAADAERHLEDKAGQLEAAAAAAKAAQTEQQHVAELQAALLQAQQRVEALEVCCANLI